MSGGFTPEERLAEGRRIASNPRGVDRTARELDDLYKTLLSGDYLETLISAAESGLAKANKTSITSHSVPERGGATNVAKAYNRGQIDKKQQEVDKMQTLFDVLSNIKSGSRKEAPPSGEVKPAIRKKDARFLNSLNQRAAEELLAEPDEPEVERPAIREKDARFLNSLNQRAAEELLAEPDEPEVERPAIRKKDARFFDSLDQRAAEELLAEPEVDYTDEASRLFKNTHGTEFDPNSKMDMAKLDKMKGMLAKQGGLGGMSANQFALQVYRNS